MISKENIQDIYTLSPMQEGMLFHELLDENATAYMLQVSYVESDPINPDLIKRCFQAVTDRHDILRTVFVHKKVKKPLQLVLRKCDVNFDYIDLTVTTTTAEEKKEALVQRKFDLTKEVGISLVLLKLGPNQHEFVWTWHHILLDGWCMSILSQELRNVYVALSQNHPIPNSNAPQFSRYIDWLGRQDNKLASDYWEKYLQDFDGDVTSPIPRKLNPVGGFNQEIRVKTTSEDDLRGLVNLSQSLGVTSSTIIQAAWGILMSKYNQNKEVLFGAVVSGRPPEIPFVESILGLFVNTVPVRIKYQGQRSFEDVLHELLFESSENTKYHYYPLYQIQSDVGLASQLFDHILVYYNLPQSDASKEPVEKDDLEINSSTHYDLTLSFSVERNLVISAAYNANIYSGETIDSLLKNFVNLLSLLVAAPKTTLDEIELSTETEKEKILNEFNATEAEFSQKTITELITKQVQSDPNKDAVIFQEEKLTYLEMENLANQWSNYLINEVGVRPGNIIGVLLERSVYLPSILLGIIKSGCLYLPLDNKHPDNRIQYQLEDAAAGFLISDHRWESEWKGQRLYVPDLMDEIKRQSSRIPLEQPDTGDMYVIYTSGSTGLPKGVKGNHDGVKNRLLWMIDELGISNQDVFLQKTSYTFDVSVWELFLPLCIGATQIQCRQEDIYNPERLGDLISLHQVTVIHFVAGMMQAFNDQMKDVWQLGSLRYVIQSGEALSPIVAKKFKATLPQVRLFNLYGPTEASIEVSHYEVSGEEELIPIGKPIANVQLYVLSPNLKLQPVGLPGEIAIGGIGLARGYINRPELTSRRFVESPFQKDTKLYLTGDLGKWQFDGTIVYMGRLDDQVKLRGYRIELGEIEDVLLNHKDINEAAVLMKGKGSDAFLVAFVAGSDVSSEVLRQHLDLKLPSYMIPSEFVFLEELPHTTSGKINRKYLQALQFDKEGSLYEFIAPNTDVQIKLAEIWKEVLDQDRISIRDDFFELGGHSLKAVILLGRIHKEFNVSIPLKEIFKNSRLEQQAGFISGSSRSFFQAIPKVDLSSDYPLSHAQRRLWVLSQFHGASSAYHIPSLVELEGELNYEALSNAFVALIDRHEILRTTFVENTQKEIRQVVQSTHELGFELYYNQIPNNHFQHLEEQVKMDVETPFDFAQGPLIRAHLYQVGEQRHVLSLVIHHIISDAWSIEIMFREIAAFYYAQITNTSPELLPLPIQHKDYSVWQQEDQKRFQQDRAYWLRQFEEDVPSLALPIDYTRPVVKTFNGALKSRLISIGTIQAFKQLLTQQDCTLFMGLVTVINTLFYRYSGQSDIIIGTPVAGRNHPDLEGQIGFFINTLAIRTKFSGAESSQELLKVVKALTLEAYDHQSYPFDLLVNELNLDRDTSRNPLFDVMVVLQNTDQSGFDQQLGNLEIKEYPSDFADGKFDLTFTFIESDEGLNLALEYNTDLFEDSTIERLIGHLDQLLLEMSSSPDKPLMDLAYLTKGELEVLLQDNSGHSSEAIFLDLFDAQVSRNPDAIALISDENTLTYYELNSLSNQVSNFLQSERDLASNDLVGMMVSRSEWMVVSLLAILKSGAAYIPIDLEYPQNRIDHMVEDSNCKLVIDDSTIEAIKKGLNQYSDKLEKRGKADDPAYVIYTSGSTGKPKGSMINRRQFTNLISFYANDLLELTPDDHVLLMAPISFDLAQKNVFAPLIAGARLCVPKSLYFDYDNLVKVIDQRQVTVVNAAPSAFYPVLDYSKKHNYKTLDSLKYVVLGGEPIRMEEFDFWKATDYFNAKIINSYGPTECTDVVSYYIATSADIAQNNNMPIGGPIPNCQIYILDDQDHLVPFGVEGEICIGGLPVGMGYLNKPELTNYKFLPDPFHLGQQIYKTGDIGKWTADHHVEFIGRKDDQVKIRGFRIELGEIETALQQHPQIKLAVVLARPNEQGAKELVAYFTGIDEIFTDQLQEYLIGLVPGHMIPSRYLQVDEMPLTPSGKINKKRLLQLEGETTLSNIIETPETSLEKDLADIWKDVLQKDDIGVTDNFFLQGGHSLKAIKIINQIDQLLNMRLSIEHLFLFPTIKGIVPYLEDNHSAQYEGDLAPIEEQDYYQVTYAQEKLWVQYKTATEKTIYNMTGVFNMSGDLNIPALSRSFEKVLENHESLRTRFRFIDELPRMIIDNPMPKMNDLKFEDISDYRDDRLRQRSMIDAALGKEFDLEKDHPIVIHVFRIDEEQYTIVMEMHHIISDGWSIELFESEMLTNYVAELSSEPLENATKQAIQFKDFMAWQQSQTKNKANEVFWKEQLKYPIPQINLPYDKEKTLETGLKGSAYSFDFEEEITMRIRGFCEEQQVSLYIFLMSAYVILMYRITGQSEIMVGSPFTGRNDPRIEKLIGFFVNTLPLRFTVNRSDSLQKFLERVKRIIIKAHEHQYFEFDRILDEASSLAPNQKAFDINFGFNALEDKEQVMVDGMKAAPEEVKVSTAPFDLTLNVFEGFNTLGCETVFKSELFKRETIVSICESLIKVVETMVENPEINIADIHLGPALTKSSSETSKLFSKTF